jgi:hypothetical protein
MLTEGGREWEDGEDLPLGDLSPTGRSECQWHHATRLGCWVNHPTVSRAKVTVPQLLPYTLMGRRLLPSEKRVSVYRHAAFESAGRLASQLLEAALETTRTVRTPHSGAFLAWVDPWEGRGPFGLSLARFCRNPTLRRFDPLLS